MDSSRFRIPAVHPQFFFKDTTIQANSGDRIEKVCRISYNLGKLCMDGRVEEAIDIIEERTIRIYKDNVYCILQECAQKKDLRCGRRVRFLVLESGLDYVNVLGDYLVRLFASTECLIEGNQAFGRVPQPSVYTWSAIISAHVNLGQADIALELYKKVKYLEVKCDQYIYLPVLKGCTLTLDLCLGRVVHKDSIHHSSFQPNAFIGSMLVNMYAKCRSLDEARYVFDMLQNKDVVCWSSMINGYVQDGQNILALQCFEEMQQGGLKPDKIVFSSVLKACCSIGSSQHGRYIHVQILKFGLQLEEFVGSILIDMYAKSSSLEEAQKVFDKSSAGDVVLWGAMIFAYIRYGEEILSLECFSSMQKHGVFPNEVVLLSVLKACGNVQDLSQGRQIHAQIIEGGFNMDINLGNSLLQMYANCGCLKEACDAFNSLPYQDNVSWNTMIAGYAQHGKCFSALEWFENMRLEVMVPDNITYLSIFKACGDVGAIEYGRHIHAQTMVHELQLDSVMGSILIDMYARCGSLEEAQRVFETLSNQDVVAWGAMIAGYAQLGNAEFALECFEYMKQSGIQPDEVSFAVILNACSHAGLVDKGRDYFKSMSECHGIMPNVFHYNCIVNLLSRAGFVTEAEELLRTLSEPNICGWTTLLSSCRTHGNLELGKRCFNEIIHLESNYVAAYVLLSNIYADISF